MSDLPDIDEIRQWIEQVNLADLHDENAKAWWLDAKALLVEVDRLRDALLLIQEHGVVDVNTKRVLGNALAKGQRT